VYVGFLFHSLKQPFKFNIDMKCMVLKSSLYGKITVINNNPADVTVIPSSRLHVQTSQWIETKTSKETSFV